MTDDLPDETGPDDALADPVFDELFTALREAGHRPAPPVQPALATLLATGAAARRRRGARGATVGLAVVGVLAGGVGAAAATGHLAVRPPAVTRVADRPTEVPLTGEPGEHPPTRGGPTDTATAHQGPAESDPDDVVEPRTDTGTAPRPTRSRDGESSASDDPSSGDGAGDADDDVQNPTPEVSEDDDSADGDGDHSGPGGGGDGSDDLDDGSSDDGVDLAG